MKYISLMSKFFIRVVPLTFKYWWIALTILVFLPAVFLSIKTGLDDGDLKEPMKELGVLLVSADAVIYDKVPTLEFKTESLEGIFQRIQFLMEFMWFVLLNFWKELWMIVFVFMAFYKGFVFFGGESVKGVRSTLMSISAMAFVQIMVQGIPFKGIYSLLRLILEVAM